MNGYVEYMMNKLVLSFGKSEERQGSPAVLIICRQPLGDTVLASPLIRGLRAVYPEHHITLVCSPENFNLLERCPYVDEILPYAAQVQGNYLRSHLGKARRFAREHFGKYSYELAVIPCTGMPSLPEAWLAYFSGAKRRFSYSERFNAYMHREFKGLYDAYFTDVWYDEDVRHEVERNTEILERLQLPVAGDELELWTDEEDKAKAEELWQMHQLDTEAAKILVNLSTSAPRKDWSVERYVYVCRQIRGKYEAEFILIGAGNVARAYGDAFLKDFPDAHDFIGKTTIRETVELMRKADFYLGGDTGPAHFAAACHLKGLVIYSTGRDIRGSLYNYAVRLSPWQAPLRVVQPEHCLPGCEQGCLRKQPHCILQVTTKQVCSEMETAMARAADTSDSEESYAGK